MMQNPNDVKKNGQVPPGEPLPKNVPPPEVPPAPAQEDAEDTFPKDWWYDIGGEG